MTENKTNNENFILDNKAIIVLLLSFFVSSFFIKILVDSFYFLFHKDISNNAEFIVFGYLATFLPIIFSFDYFITRKNGKKLIFNIKRSPFYIYMIVFPMMFGMILIGEFVTSLIPINGPVLGEWYKFYSDQINQISDNTFLIFLLVSIIAPIVEEILFRGIIQKGLINKGVKPINAIIIASLIFGFIHFNPWQFMGAFLLGLVLGYIFYITESLLLPILLHSFNNTLVAVLLKFYDTESFGDLFHVNQFTILIVGIIIFSLFCYLFIKVKSTKLDIRNEN